MPRHHGSIIAPTSWALFPLELSRVIRSARQAEQLTASSNLVFKHSAARADGYLFSARRKAVTVKEVPCHGGRFSFLPCPQDMAANEDFLREQKKVEVLDVFVGTSPHMIRAALALGVMRPQGWDNAGETGPSRSPVVFQNSQCWVARLHCLSSNLKNKHIYF